ncbi:MAG TPA: EAL domain-containing protein [Candidatus Limnocylindrales bacterium]|nr:EAL domain-containing protein [Candidatus Limnocylindrales bacterium]
MRFFSQPKPSVGQRLFWSRDIRFARRLADEMPGARLLEIDQGIVLIGPGTELTDARAAAIGELVHSPPYGIVDLDPSLPEGERHIAALSAAVQQSGLADRIGMSQTTQSLETKTLDYFFNLRNVHAVAFQPIVEIRTGELYEYECLFRPNMPMLPQSITAIVHAAIDTDRSVELDAFIIRLILARTGRLQEARESSGMPPLRIALNITPASLLDPQFEARALTELVLAAGLSPRQVTVECTEQQAVPDVVPLVKRVKALRRAGFGFAVDDAGAGYASFAMIAALRPSVIKIDREITHGIARDTARQALVEAFVSFGRRIGARLLAEGIERRADLAMLSSLGVELGQGYLIGRPAAEPAPPRPMETLRLDVARAKVGRQVRNAVPRRRARAVTAE